jgi:LDH2 family malate/lactate/ureidoglycolate dehydrogenase
MTPEQQSAVAEMTDEQFRQHALEILQKTLGAGGFARFLRVYRPGSGDFTRDRHKWQEGITVQQIVEDIKKRRENPV